MEIPDLSINKNKKRQSISKKRWEQPTKDINRRESYQSQSSNQRSYHQLIDKSILSQNILSGQKDLAAPYMNNRNDEIQRNERNKIDYKIDPIKEQEEVQNFPNHNRNNKSKVSIQPQSKIQTGQVPYSYPTPKQSFVKSRQSSQLRQSVNYSVISNPYVPQSQKKVLYFPNPQINQQVIQKVTPQPQVIRQNPPSVYLQSNASSIVQSSQQSAPCFAQTPQNIPIQNQMIVQRPLPQNQKLYSQPIVQQKSEVPLEQKSPQNLESEFNSLQQKQEDLLKMQRQIAERQGKIAQHLQQRSQMNYQYQQSMHQQKQQILEQTQHIQQQQVNQIQQNVYQINQTQNQQQNILNHQQNLNQQQNILYGESYSKMIQGSSSQSQKILALKENNSVLNINIDEEHAENEEVFPNTKLKGTRKPKKPASQKQIAQEASEDEFIARIDDIVNKIQDKQEEEEIKTVFKELKELKQNSTKENQVFLRQMDQILEKYGKNTNESQPSNVNDESKVSSYNRNSGKISKFKQYLSITKNMTFDNS